MSNTKKPIPQPIPADFLIGVEQQVENLRNLFTTKTDLEVCFSLAKTGQRDGMTFPRVFSKAGEYDPMTPNDNVKALGFFYLLDKSHDPVNQFTRARIAFICSMNLKKFYKSDNIETTEPLQHEITKVLRGFPNILPQQEFDYYNEAADVYREFSIRDPKHHTFPYGCFRIEFSIRFFESC